jgi:quercetin dioxygenase-like cupin family protein
MEPGTRVDLHAHDFPELGMVLSGTGALVFEEGTRTTETGDSYYIPGRLPHGYLVPDGGSPVLLLNVEASVGTALSRSVDPGLAQRMRESIGPSPARGPRGRASK